MWPLVLYAAFVLALVAGMITTSYVLGQHHSDKATIQPYESGIVTSGPTYVRYGAHFYLVALFFVVFDIEAAFLLAWAVAAREAGWWGYWGVVSFIAVLSIILIYAWKERVLDWGNEVGRRKNA